MPFFGFRVVLSILIAASCAIVSSGDAQCPGVREFLLLRKLGGGEIQPAVRMLESQSLAVLPAAKRSAALENLARAYSVLRKFGDAAQIRQAMLENVNNGDAFAILKLVAALVQDLRSAGNFVGAAAALTSARARLAGDGGDFATAALLQMEAHIDDCRGGATAAAASLASARDLLARGGDAAAAAPTEQEELQRVHVLHKAAAESASSEYAMQFAVASAALVARGPWRHVAQLPRAFDAGLPDTPPWLAGDDEVISRWPWLQPLVPLLRDAAPALAVEYAALSRAHALEEETDCIHTEAAGAGAGGSGGGGGSRGGGWRVLTVNGAGFAPEALDGACCASALAPAACALLAACAQAVPRARLLRGGYSAVGPHTYLRPHFGLTNAQIKLHVGVVVPFGGGGSSNRSSVGGGVASSSSDDSRAVRPDGSAAAADALGGACSWLRVAGEARGWRAAGQVLVFDDSWEHELRNDCASERVVFQLVIGHPDAA